VAFDLDEQEKLDTLKDWWKRWGNMFMLGLAALLIGIAGWQYWQRHTSGQRAEAAVLYNRLMEAQAAKDVKLARDTGAKLIEDYAGTAYAPRAALLLARASVDARDIKSARAQFEWVIEHAREAGLKDVARLRLAGVLLDEKHYDEALKTLASAHSDAFKPRFDDLRGDVLAARGDRKGAREAYDRAWRALPETDQYRQILEIKLDAYGGPLK
jgi:predicted negative regulator of RcsB-dependent stress response